MRQYRIGLMVGNKTIDYPHSIRMGVQNTLEEAGHLLVAIADLVPYHTRFNAEGYFRVAFEIAGRLDLDAVIVPAGVVTGYLSGNDAMTHEFLAAMNPKKSLVLERDIPGYRCITKDNGPGMHECMEHLIETCGFKKIAFISGPEASQGAREREQIYFEEMERHHLPVTPEMFARGLFSGDCEDVIEKVLDENPNIEAIACACDFIAYTAYRMMRGRKIAIGHDVAVTGFDDHPKSANIDPPLSTVHMTGYDLGCMAAREAIRICEGKPQKETVITSRFIARNSCGENMRSGVDYFRELLRKKPFPAETFVDVLMDATMSMAGKQATDDFRRQMEVFFAGIRDAYLRHRDGGEKDVLLFSSQDLSLLFRQDYRNCLSLEGFHSVAINLLEALLEESPKEDASWVIAQISHLHLRIARLSGDAQQEETFAMNKREWDTFHMADDALREDRVQDATYRQILGEFPKLGVRHAELFLLPEPVTFIGAKSFAMSDGVEPIGYLAGNDVTMTTETEAIGFHKLLETVLSHNEEIASCTVGGIMAGDELLGVAVIDGGTLDDNGQLMAFLNMGFALKHLQMISNEREVNRLLQKNNLLLKRQSMQDEMTGLLNRRGFLGRLEHTLTEAQGKNGAVVYLDLDGLKAINDSFGHDVGDDAIRCTAELLRKGTPGNGFLGRLGGDEFVVFIFLHSQEQIDIFGETIQKRMQQFNETEKKAYSLSISYGGRFFLIDEYAVSHIMELMVEADEKLYEMKRLRKGKRRFEEEKDR